MNDTALWIVTGLFRATIGLAVAALLVALAVRLLRAQSPRAEQFAWFLVLAHGVFIVPVSLPVPASWLESVVPQVRHEPASPATADPPRVHLAPDLAAGDDRERAEREVDNAASQVTITTATSAETSAATSEGTSAATSRASQNSRWLTRLTLPVALVAIWLAGISVCAALGIRRYRAYLRRMQLTQPVLPEWKAEWHAILDQQRVETEIPLVATLDAGPALCRVRSGYLLAVPTALWWELDPAQRSSILKHELAHFQRGDLWTALAARVLAVLHWFNPFAWWAAARFDAQCEYACDRVAAGNDPTTLAETLIHLGSGCHLGVAGVQSARSGSLFDRVQRLLKQPSCATRSKGACLVVLALTVLALATLRPHAMALPPAGEQVSDAGSSAPLPGWTKSIPTARPLLKLGTEILRTRGHVTDIDFSPDGKLIAASETNVPHPTLRLFDVQTGTEKKRITPADKPSGWIQCLAFSPDQTKLAWGENGGQVTLWDVTTDRLIWREKIHQNRVNDVAFSPDGKLLASCADDGAALLRKVADPARGAQRLDTGKGPGVGESSRDDLSSSGGISLAFTPDGARLVVGSGATAEISIWRIQDGKLVGRIEKAHGNSRGFGNPGLQTVSVTPDGRQIVSSGQHTVPISETKLKYGSRNVTMTEIRAWDLETGKRVRDLNGDQDHGFGYAALSPDGKRIAVGDFSILRILDAGTGRAEQTISLPGSWGKPPRFSPDGKIVAMPIGNSIGLFEVATGRRLHHDEQSPNGEPASAAWSPSGDRLVTGHSDGGVRVWDAATGTLLWNKLLAPVVSPSGWKARPAFVAFSADSHRIVAAGRRDDPVNWRNGIVTVYEAKRGKLIDSIEQKEIRHAALSPDRRLVVVATSHGGINDTHLIGIELATGRTLYTTPSADKRAGFWQLNAMQFRPASSDILLGDGNGDVIQLDGMTGKEQRRFVADHRQAAGRKQFQVWQAGFSADGRTLVTCSAEIVAVWNVETGTMIHKIFHPHAHGCHVAVSPDGKTVATSDLQYAGDYGEDTIRLFDLGTGKQVMTMEAKDKRAVVMAFSPDGTKLFTGFYGGSATIWDVRR